MINGYKGFDKDLKCRGFQFELGKEYTATGKIECCENGFHFCEYPLDVFGYYPPANSRYVEVVGSGEIDKDNNNSKVACETLKIGVEIGLPGLIKAGVEYIKKQVDWNNKSETNTGDYSAATNTGDYSAATNTGDYSAATNTGDYSAATNTGDYSAATNTGYGSAATNTGDYSAATNTGDYSAATNTGDYSAATNTGYGSAATNTGDYSAATNTGDYSAATNTGDYSAATNTGDYSAATNTGYGSAATNTGDYSAATNTGDYSAATNTGDYSAATNTGGRSAATVEGEESVAISIGIEGKAKGKIGCWLVLSEWERLPDRWKRKEVKSFYVDGDKVKEDVFYVLKNGELAEDEEEC